MELLQTVFRIFLVGNILSRSLSTVVTLYPVKQDDFITECQEGLLINDTIVFKSHIPLNRSELFDNNTYVDYKVIYKDQKEHETYNVIRKVSMECGDPDQQIVCKKYDNSMIFSHNVIAEERFINATMSVSIKRDETSIGNDSQVFPTMYDTRNAFGNLTINDIDISINDCIANISSHDLTMKFECSSLAKPCMIEIKANDSTGASYHNKSANFKRVLQNQAVLAIVIKYKPCSLNGNVSIINCIVTVGLNSHNGEDDFNIIIYAVFGGLVASIAVVITIVYILKKRRNRKRNRRFHFFDCLESNDRKDGYPDENFQLRAAERKKILKNNKEKKSPAACNLSNGGKIVQPYEKDFTKIKDTVKSWELEMKNIVQQTKDYYLNNTRGLSEKAKKIWIEEFLELLCKVHQGNTNEDFISPNMPETMKNCIKSFANCIYATFTYMEENYKFNHMEKFENLLKYMQQVKGFIQPEETGGKTNQSSDKTNSKNVAEVEDQDKDFQAIIQVDIKLSHAHKGIYNKPEASEVGAVIVGNTFEYLDNILKSIENKLQRIKDTHISYDALQYPLMFSNGEGGSSVSIPQVDPDTTFTYMEENYKFSLVVTLENLLKYTKQSEGFIQPVSSQIVDEAGDHEFQDTNGNMQIKSEETGGKTNQSSDKTNNENVSEVEGKGVGESIMALKRTYMSYIEEEEDEQPTNSSSEDESLA
ncbi:unnamed protein product [Lymnaea stagnalis]|uniref:Uncharacterized protein n=1 Tax=Lymnaea stagnalis TaxID=6523 RepID=A0AAV2H2N5_LYMST